MLSFVLRLSVPQNKKKILNHKDFYLRYENSLNDYFLNYRIKVSLTMNKSTENSRPKNPGLCCVFSTQFFLPYNFCSSHGIGFCLSSKYILGQPGYFFFHLQFLYLWKLCLVLTLDCFGFPTTISELQSHFPFIVTALTGRFRNTLKHTPQIIGHLSNLTSVDGFDIYMVVLCLATKYMIGLQ